MCSDSRCAKTAVVWGAVLLGAGLLVGASDSAHALSISGPSRPVIVTDTSPVVMTAINTGCCDISVSVDLRDFDETEVSVSPMWQDIAAGHSGHFEVTFRENVYKTGSICFVQGPPGGGGIGVGVAVCWGFEVDTRTVMTVGIDIKPGSDPNSINLDSHGTVPVAILSDPGFDATAVDPGQVYLGGAGVAIRGKGNRLMASEEDVNGDGLLDLVVHVETENLDPGTFQDGYACLIGYTYGGQEIEGWDELTIVPPE